MTKKRKSIPYSFYFLLQLIVLLVCYSIYLNKWIQPSVFPYFGISALIFPIFFIIHCILAIIGLFLKRKRSIAIFIFTFPIALSFANINRLPAYYLKDYSSFKVMSFNVQYGYKGIDKLNTYLEQSNADIVCLQEIYKRHWRKETLLSNNYNAVYDYVGISSKYPIVYDEQIRFPNSNAYACFADININNDTIRVFNVYLESVYLSRVLKDISTPEDVEKNTEVVKNKLVTGYRNHQWQLNALQLYIKNSPYPVVLAGDFNSVPNSYEYFFTTKHLTDAFTEHGSGSANSVLNYKFPIRIDYIFHDQHFTSGYYKVDRSFHFSDHYPVFTTLKKAQP